VIDTHTHPYLEEFADGGSEAVERALAAGVTHMVLPNVDESSILPMMSLHERYPEVTSVAMGLHPTEVGENWQEIVDRMENLLLQGGFVAVGEVGIDLYWDRTYRASQIECFKRQLRIAGGMGLPVIIHCREGLDETLAAISEVKPDTRLIFHSFTGSPEDVERIRRVCDPMFGINGVVTFKNARPLREAIPLIGADRILLETDAPYLAPVPHRGKRNEPAFVTHTCAKVAEVLGRQVSEVEALTDANARGIFNL
jgi:TatD DNase family protein